MGFALLPPLLRFFRGPSASRSRPDRRFILSEEILSEALSTIQVGYLVQIKFYIEAYTTGRWIDYCIATDQYKVPR